MKLVTGRYVAHLTRFVSLLYLVKARSRLFHSFPAFNFTVYNLSDSCEQKVVCVEILGQDCRESAKSRLAMMKRICKIFGLSFDKSNLCSAPCCYRCEISEILREKLIGSELSLLAVVASGDCQCQGKTRWLPSLILILEQLGEKRNIDAALKADFQTLQCNLWKLYAHFHAENRGWGKCLICKWTSTQA